jgi:hypothetical protein
MSSNSDSKGGAARAPKRSAHQSLCEDSECAGFGKSLGIGRCQGCCSSRGVQYKPQKFQKQPLGNAKSPTASDLQNTKQPAPSSIMLPVTSIQVPVLPVTSIQVPDVYFVNKATEAVKSVSFEDLWAWMVQKGAVDPICERSQIQKEDMILIMAQNNMEYDVAVTVDSSQEPDIDQTEYQKLVRNLSADHSAQGSPPRKRPREQPRSNQNHFTDGAKKTNLTPSKKKPSPSKECSDLASDTAKAMQTFQHRADVADGQRRLFTSMESSPLTSYQQLLPELDEQLPTDSTDGALINDVYLQMGIDVEARWISNDMGYGIFSLKEIPADVNVTTYDGPRVNCHTGEILFECPFTHGIETKYTTCKQFTRSRKWGDYENEHCVLLEHSNDVRIDGTFSSQPFLFTEGFHGGTGFGASFNSGKGIFVNIKKLYKRSSRFAHDSNGQLDQVTLCSNN